mmetsp:Transcript_34436/g.92283  ORF Transcript_34436/g.92283 Transcript_34436/m.92283 type:complete len:282 (-) Transcript_34436:46-891(-)
MPAKKVCQRRARRGLTHGWSSYGQYLAAVGPVVLQAVLLRRRGALGGGGAGVVGRESATWEAWPSDVEVQQQCCTHQGRLPGWHNLESQVEQRAHELRGARVLGAQPDGDLARPAGLRDIEQRGDRALGRALQIAPARVGLGVPGLELGVEHPPPHVVDAPEPDGGARFLVPGPQLVGGELPPRRRRTSLCVRPSPGRRAARGRAYTAIHVVSSLVRALPARGETRDPEALGAVAGRDLGRESDHVAQFASGLHPLIPRHLRTDRGGRASARIGKGNAFTQ